MSYQEAREVERRQLTCLVGAVYEGSSDTIPLHPPDLSPRGMFIHTSLFLPVGSVLKMRLLLSGREFQVRGEVRHCVQGQGVGVEFIDPSPDVVQAIQEESEIHASCIHVVTGEPSKTA